MIDPISTTTPDGVVDGPDGVVDGVSALSPGVIPAPTDGLFSNHTNSHAKSRTPPRLPVEFHPSPAKRPAMLYTEETEKGDTNNPDMVPVPPFMDDWFPNVDEEDDLFEGPFTDSMTQDDHATSVQQEENNPHKVIQDLADRTYIERKAGYHSLFSKEDMASIDLLRILEEKRMPLGSYDLIRKWASKWTEEGTDFILLGQSTREATVKNLSKRLGYDSLQSTVVPILLPCAKDKYDMPTFSFAAQFAAMLADPRLMRHEFLQFNQPDDIMAGPMQEPRGDTFWHCDTNHGSLYRQSYDKVIDGPNQFLVMLMFFSDKTHTDRHGRLTLEPLIFCPASLFNLKARQNPMFRSILGYLPSSSNYQYLSAQDKMDDYHFALEIMLEELKTLQHSGKPLVLDLVYYKTLPDGTVVEVVQPEVHFFFRILTVNGDSEGQNKQSGKIGATGKNVKIRQCRICDVSFDNLDDPEVKGKQVVGPRIAKLVAICNDEALRRDQRQRAKGQLQEANFRPVHLGWSDMLFCDTVNGINGSVPPDILHMVRHGLVQYLLTSFFGLKRLLVKPRKAKTIILDNVDNEEDEDSEADEVNNDEDDDSEADEEDDTEEDDPEEDDVVDDDDDDDDDAEDDDAEDYIVDDDDAEEDDALEDAPVGDEVVATDTSLLSTFGVFTESVNTAIDAYAKRLGRVLQRQSCKDYARAYFAHGISSNSKKDGFEEVMVVLLLFIIMNSDGIGTDLRHKMDDNMSVDSVARSDAWIELLFAIQMVDECLHWNWIRRDELRQLKEYMPLFLARYKAVVNRRKANQMKILKFHLMTHVVSVYDKVGLFKAVDTERTEAAHKAHKRAGLLTSRNTKYFEVDVAKRYFESQVIQAASESEDFRRCKLPTKNKLNLQNRGPLLEGPFHFVDSHGCFLSPSKTKKKNNGPHSSWGDDQLTYDLTLFIQQKILQKLKLDRIQLYTKATVVLKRQDKYSGDPEYFCATIRAHLHFRSHSERIGYPNFHWVFIKGPPETEDTRLVRCLAFCEIKGGQYIIGQCNEEVPYLIRSEVQELVKGFTAVPNNFRLISLKDVVNTAVVIPNNLDQPEPVTNWMLIRGKDTWTNMFRYEMTQRIASAATNK
jgi:hypothetical protein